MLRSAFHLVLVLAFVGAVLPAQQGDVIRASQLMKMEVRTSSNDVVGEVRDIVLDRQTGGVAYAIVALNRIPSKAGRLFAVPWQALTPAADRKGLVLPIGKDAILTLPGFDANNWPDMTDARWANAVGVAYGIRPRTGTLTQPEDEARLIGTRDTVARPGTAAARQSRAAVISGTVVALLPGFPGDSSEVVIETEFGDVDALLAPITWLNNQRLTFDVNANVRVRGYTTIADNRQIFVVTEAMTHPGSWVRLRNDDLSAVWSDDIIDNVRYISGTVESAGNGYATLLTDAEGLRTVAIAPANYFESRHWRLRRNRLVGVTGYDDPRSKQFVAITIDHAGERWRVRWDDGTPLWKDENPWYIGE